jgi:hypothetical protein
LPDGAACRGCPRCTALQFIVQKKIKSSVEFANRSWYNCKIKKGGSVTSHYFFVDVTFASLVFRVDSLLKTDWMFHVKHSIGQSRRLATQNSDGIREGICPDAAGVTHPGD